MKHKFAKDVAKVAVIITRERSLAIDKGFGKQSKIDTEETIADMAIAFTGKYFDVLDWASAPAMSWAEDKNLLTWEDVIIHFVDQKLSQ